jgi:soluble lytic murein transglycosylase
VAIYNLFHRPALLTLALLAAPLGQSTQRPAELAPTVHPTLPAEASELWLVPSETDRAARSTAAFASLATGVKRLHEENYTAALALFSQPSLAKTALGDYAAYYKGIAQLRLGQLAEARRTLDTVFERTSPGYVSFAAGLASAEAAETAGDHAAAVRIYDRIAEHKSALSEEVLSRLGSAALAAGDRAKAAQAFVRVYYEFPLTDAAAEAGAQLPSLQDRITRTGYNADLGRAQILFGARRFDEARTAFQSLQGVVQGDDKELVDLRVAECDFNLKRYAAARDGVRPYLDRASRKAEARFFYLSSLRELGDEEQYFSLTAALVSEFPDSSWSEEALSNLGTYYILEDSDDDAARTFKELYQRFPSGARSERAAWKYGWWAYTEGHFAETVRIFESAAATFPRSDYRPSFLYWAARSHARLGQRPQADSRLRLIFTDYANSYYGRLAARRLEPRADALVRRDDVRLASSAPAQMPDVKPIQTEPLIRLLLANGLYDDALSELRYAQRAWGNSPRLDATIAWVYNQKGELRRAISLMRRTYPQFLTAGGQELPTEILQVIFPLAYWESIRRYSAAHDLDPYLVAALIGQESTFDPGIRSVANAWGLMQLVPATGRRLARSVGIRNFSTAKLTDPEINIRLGTLYFSRLVAQFGGTYYALASYNAGENRVVRWRAERPGMDEDEFIDDIPFPETQNYVKRVLGTAEDYRRLYGGGATPRSRSTIAPNTRAVPNGTVRKPPAKKNAPAVKTTPPAKKKAPARPAGQTPRSNSR